MDADIGDEWFRGVLSTAVLDAEAAPGIGPLDRTVNAGDLAGTALQTTGVFHHHLPFVGKGIKIRRAGVDAITFPAGMTDLLIQTDMGLLVVFESIQSQLLSNLH